MSYAIAAYAVVLGSLVAYGIHLALERRALRKALPPQGKRDPG